MNRFGLFCKVAAIGFLLSGCSAFGGLFGSSSVGTSSARSSVASSSAHSSSEHSSSSSVHVHVGGEPTQEALHEATCVKDGYYYEVVRCVEDGYEMSSRYVGLPALGHDYEKTGETDPDYEHDGIVTYTCTRCGKTKTEPGKPKVGHAFSSEWSVDEKAGTHYHACIDPGYEDMRQDEAEHEYGDWTTATEATLIAKGKETATCVTCGHTIERETDRKKVHFTLDYNGGTTKSTLTEFDANCAPRTEQDAEGKVVTVARITSLPDLPEVTFNGYSSYEWYCGNTKITSGANFATTYVDNLYKLSYTLMDLEENMTLVCKPLGLNNYAIEYGGRLDTTYATSYFSGVEFRNPTSYTVESEITLKDAYFPGYAFKYWKVSGGYSNLTTGARISKIKKGTYGRLELTAYFDYAQNDLKVESSDPERGEVELLRGTGVTAQTISVQATAKENYLFYGWYDGIRLMSQKENYIFTMPARDTYVLTAKFLTPAEYSAKLEWDRTHGVFPTVWETTTQLGNEKVREARYGLYPQTIVTAESIIDELDALEADPETGYIFYENEYYYPYDKHTFTKDGVTYSHGNRVYFLLEPLKWRMARDSVGLSKQLIDGGYYNDRRMASRELNFLGPKFYSGYLGTPEYYERLGTSAVNAYTDGNAVGNYGAMRAVIGNQGPVTDYASFMTGVRLGNSKPNITNGTSADWWLGGVNNGSGNGQHYYVKANGDCSNGNGKYYFEEETDYYPRYAHYFRAYCTALPMKLSDAPKS